MRKIYLFDEVTRVYTKTLTVDGIRPWNSTYKPVPSGGLFMFTGGNWVRAPTPAPVIPITITSITGAIESSDLTSITAEELVEVTITATIPLGVDTSFRMPITREDTGRVIYKLANIVDNVMTMVVALPTSGKWLVSEDQINGGLQGDGFTFSFVGLEVVVV